MMSARTYERRNGGLVAAIVLMLFAAAPLEAAADTQLGLSVGRAFDSDETEVIRFAYRHDLSREARPRWWPQQLQFGAGAWRAPDPQGQTRRYEASVTPVWRREGSLGYIEGGIGAYLLSHTVHNDKTQLPSAFQFGSHVGAGFFAGKASVGLALQHISNAGIKTPNGGINLYFLTVQLPL